MNIKNCVKNNILNNSKHLHKQCAKIQSKTQKWITEKNKKLAESKVLKICNDLRIYNPLVSKVTVNVNQS